MSTVIDRERLYSIIKKQCGNGYAIGIHGIDEHRLTEQDGPIQEQIKNMKENILNNGFYIKSNRTLLGTVTFRNPNLETEKDFINYHRYGDSKEYILIVLPKTLKNKKGEEIYVGSPTYHNIYPDKIQTQGYQLTSLSDAIIPNYQNGTSILPSMFVLGSFSIIDENKIELTLNQNHISFNKGVLPDEYFNQRKQMILSSAYEYGIAEQLKSFSLKNLIQIFKNLDEIMKFDDAIANPDTDTIQRKLESLNRKNSTLAPIQIKTIQNAINPGSVSWPTNMVPGNFPTIFNETIRQYIKEKFNIDIIKMLSNQIKKESTSKII